MAAGLGFKTFNTGDVLTAGDTNGYLMQGVLVFDDAAARDAAITAPAEGQFAYLKDTDVTTYYNSSAWANLDTTGMVNPMTTTGDTIYSSSGSTPARLEIGSTGEVLTVAGGVPTWAAPAGGGDTWTLLNTTTLPTGTNSVTITGLTSEKILITITNATHAGGGSGFYYVTPTCGTTTGSEWRGLKRSTTATMLANDQSANAPIANSTTAGSDLIKGYVLYTGCQSTSGGKIVQSTGGSDSSAANTGSYTGGGIVMATAALTGFTFANTTNNFASGTLKVYGA
jgi:hypothetical protein